MLDEYEGCLEKLQNLNDRIWEKKRAFYPQTIIPYLWDYDKNSSVKEEELQEVLELAKKNKLHINVTSDLKADHLSAPNLGVRISFYCNRPSPAASCIPILTVTNRHLGMKPGDAERLFCSLKREVEDEQKV